MAQRDPAVENLEAFIGVLTDTIDKVSSVQPALEEQAQALGDLHDDAGQELGGFDSDLDRGLGEVDSLADDAKAELEKLESTASDGTKGALSEAESAFDEWKDKLGGTLDDAAETVSDASEDLSEDGFDEATEAVQEATKAIESSKESTDAGFEALVAKLGTEGDRFTGSLVTAGLEAQGAAEAADVLESQFEGKANWVTDDIKSASGSAVAVHQETGSNAGSFYDGVEGRAQSEAQELIGEMKEAFQDAATRMVETATEPLEEPVESLVQNALDPFADEVGNWKDQNDTAEQGLSTWDQHLLDLTATLKAVAEIDKLNEALG